MRNMCSAGRLSDLGDEWERVLSFRKKRKNASPRPLSPSPWFSCSRHFMHMLWLSLSCSQNACISEGVSSGTIRRFEWILRQFKEETRWFSSAKSSFCDAEMAQRRPKLRTQEFLRHTLGTSCTCRGLTCIYVLRVAKTLHIRVCPKRNNPQVRVDFASVQGRNPKA